MSRNLETELSNLPQFSPPVSFRDDLRAQLMPQPSASKPSLWRLGLLGITAILLLVVLSSALLRHQNPIAPQTVSAAEIIHIFMSSHFQPGKIVHQQTWQFEGKKSDYQANTGRFFDMWSDQNSDRFFQKVIYPDQSTMWFGTTLDFSYHINPQDNKITLFPSSHPPEEREIKHNQDIDITLWLNGLLADQTLVAVPGTDQNRRVYIIHDTRDSNDKYWDTFYFDFDTKRLLAVEKEKDGFFTRIDYTSIESLERTPENLAFFSFPPQQIDITGLEIVKLVTNPDTGEHQYLPASLDGSLLEEVEEDSAIEEELIEIEDISQIVPDESVAKMFRDNLTSFSFELPRAWQASSFEQTESNTSVAFTSNGQHLLHLSVTPNYNPDTNQPYLSLEEFFHYDPNQVDYYWSDQAQGKMLEGDGSKLYAFFSPTRKYLMTIKIPSNQSEEGILEIAKTMEGSRFE